MSWSLVIGHWSLRLVRAAAREMLPVLLVLYPLLLLLDDLEPGFVRSVVNPHWFLIALIVVGVAGEKKEKSFPPSHREGEEGGWGTIVVSIVAAAIVGVWMWWRLHAGMLGIVVALLTAVSIVGATRAFRSSDV